jgi:PBP1b-binding outer membrane lipoprotein LpoB
MMKKIYRTFCVAALILFSCIVTHAQRRQVSGTVKNETGGVMPGVTILLKGTTMGVTTDTDGKFAIQAMPEDVLKISFIGYLSEQIHGRQQNAI